jgi:glyoxylase-like metal-dependent hydrolase (beta-lactamase superfamily II)
MIEHHGNLVEVDEGYEIEPGVSILHAPGHSPGSICVSVDDGETCRVVTGDVLQYATVALTKVNPVVFWDEAAATRSIERITAMADVIYPGHDRPFHLEKEETFYEHPLELTLVGVDPDDEGIAFDRAPIPRFVMPGIEQQSLSGEGHGREGGEPHG